MGKQQEMRPSAVKCRLAVIVISISLSVLIAIIVIQVCLMFERLEGTDVLIYTFLDLAHAFHQAKQTHFASVTLKIPLLCMHAGIPSLSFYVWHSCFLQEIITRTILCILGIYWIHILIVKISIYMIKSSCLFLYYPRTETYYCEIRAGTEGSKCNCDRVPFGSCSCAEH